MKNFYNKKILFIGCGNMGEPVLDSFLRVGIKQKNIFLQENSPKRTNLILDKYQINPYQKQQVDFIILAIKPQQLAEIQFSKINTDQNTTIVSILAGTTIQTIQKISNITKIIRVMPNLPLIYKKGMSTFFVQNISSAEKKFITEVFSKSGKILELKKEEDLNITTLLAGSGPGIFFYFCNLLKQITVEKGFTTEQADLLINETFIGSAQLLQKSKKSTQDLQSMVTSKGGTTEAAINTYEKILLKDYFQQGIEQGIKRSEELSK